MWARQLYLLLSIRGRGVGFEFFNSANAPQVFPRGELQNFPLPPTTSESARPAALSQFGESIRAPCGCFRASSPDIPPGSRARPSLQGTALLLDAAPATLRPGASPAFRRVQ